MCKYLKVKVTKASMSKKISVVMSCRNHESFVEKSVLSILNQSYTNFEFLIFDDSSSDNTFDILHSLSKQDKRIKLFKNNRIIGLTKNLNTLINLCNSDIIARQDADDLSTLDRFAEFIKIYRPEVPLYTSDFYLEQETGMSTTNQSTIPSYVLFNFLFYFYFGSHGQIFFHKKLYNKHFRYCQDYEFCSDILRSNFSNFYVIKQPLYVYKRHNNTIYCRHRNKQIYFSLITAQTNIKHFLDINLNFSTILELRNMFLNNIRPTLDKNIIVPLITSMTQRFFRTVCVSDKEKHNINYLVNTSIKNSYEK